MNKIFGNDLLLDKSKTGITDMELVLTSKDSEFVKSELNAKEGFADAYMRFDYQLTPTSDITRLTNFIIPKGYTSTADVIVALSLQDQGSSQPNVYESVYIKQRFTPFNSTQIINMENSDYDNNEEFNFFRKFNIWRGNRSNAVFAQDLENIS